MRSILSIMIGFIISIMISACAHHSAPTQTQDNPRIQKAYIYDQAKQEEIIAKVQKENAYTKYVSDMDQFGVLDYFNINIYNQVQTLKKQILAGVRDATDQEDVDCDDTDIQMHLSLLREHFPADQMTHNFYLVPRKSASVTGAKTDLAGHMVEVVDIEGNYPMSLEDISVTRYQKDLEEKLGYYLIGYAPANIPFEDGWTFIDLDGYQLLMNGELSLQEAKQRALYRAHTKFINTIFHRKDFE